MDKTGLAFSGGGIRSAAFCSGVLRRLLQKNAKIDYVSCVSGGGYTGSAYVEWKYRNGKKDDKRWHQEFFNHMRQETGIVCHWQKPCQAILEFMAILALFVFVCVIVPVQLWASFAYPVAFIVDFFFGNILRGAKLSCHQEMQNNPNITLAQCREERLSLEAVDRRAALFLTPILVGFTSNVLKHCIPKARVIFKCLSISCVAFFFLVFFPWFINQFLHFVPTWLKIISLVPLFFLWISFPLNRPLATLMIGIYFLSFVVFWRVYKEDAFGITYDEQRFNVFLGIAMLIHLINPLTVTIQQRLVHVYVR